MSTENRIVNCLFETGHQTLSRVTFTKIRNIFERLILYRPYKNLGDTSDRLWRYPDKSKLNRPEVRTRRATVFKPPVLVHYQRVQCHYIRAGGLTCSPKVQYNARNSGVLKACERRNPQLRMGPKDGVGCRCSGNLEPQAASGGSCRASPCQALAPAFKCARARLEPTLLAFGTFGSVPEECFCSARYKARSLNGSLLCLRFYSIKNIPTPGAKLFGSAFRGIISLLGDTRSCC
ncbi:hypothetical protein EVAR_7216_1 [Eumeta japonica]|uniref:Uncharacterized protein n=1 Tax=Eumeta variegata TaxID=151549 RepID=A0A4C1T347_EUMVA|nr:hypothetical protein EVAR_7216_1 [Eumeta japonica]